jgi:tetratricopeptide (TPR) repeat protein
MAARAKISGGNKEVKFVLGTCSVLFIVNIGISADDLVNLAKTVSNDEMKAESDRKSIENNNQAFEYYLKGLELDHLEKFADAIILFDQAIKLKPDFAEAFDKRGLAKTKLLQYGTALRDFRHALELRPDFAEAYTHRANICYFLQEYKQAINNYTRAIELEPNYGKAYFNRALVELVIGKKKKAHKDLIMALDLNYTDADELITKYFKN